MSERKCVFCKIINKEISSEIINEEDDIVTFKDASPKAPVHLLVVPKRHITSVNDITRDDIALIGKMVYRAKEMAAKHNLDKRGYKLIFNCGPDGGQTVYHIHLHILGGKKLKE